MDQGSAPFSGVPQNYRRGKKLAEDVLAKYFEACESARSQAWEGST